MRLSDTMQVNPGASEIKVYYEFFTKSISTKEQLEKINHGDKFLRDKLLMSIDLPSIQERIRDDTPYKP